MTSRIRAARGLAIACAGVVLAGCGGGGGDSGSTPGDKTGATVPSCVPTGAATGPNVLFGADANRGTLTAFKTLTPSCENWEAHVFATVPGGANGIAYDPLHDELYVLATLDASHWEVDVYNNASALGAGATPVRSITLSDFNKAEAIALDATHNRLWVGGGRNQMADGGQIVAYEHVNVLSGAAVPDRQIQNVPYVLNMALDTTHAILYTVGGTNNSVVAYTHTDTLASGATPSLTVGGSNGTFGIAIDGARDIAYLSNAATGLRIVRNASTGVPEPAVVVPFAGTPTRTVNVDSKNDRLYLGAFSGAYVIEHASTLTASAAIPAPAASAASVVVISGFATP